MATLGYEIQWDDNVAPARAHMYAVELKDVLARRSPELHTEIKRKDEDAQDLGSTLIAIVSTGAARAIAEGIKAFFAKRGDLASVTISSPDGTSLTVHRIARKAALQLSEHALAAMFRSKQEDVTAGSSASEPNEGKKK